MQSERDLTLALADCTMLPTRTTGVTKLFVTRSRVCMLVRLFIGDERSEQFCIIEHDIATHLQALEANSAICVADALWETGCSTEFGSAFAHTSRCACYLRYGSLFQKRFFSRYF